MKYLSELFVQHIFSLFFFHLFRGLAFLWRINTRSYTKLLFQYQTVQKCAITTKPIFNHLEQVKVKFFWGKVGFHKHPGWCLPLPNDVSTGNGDYRNFTSFFVFVPQ